MPKSTRALKIVALRAIHNGLYRKSIAQAHPDPASIDHSLKIPLTTPRSTEDVVVISRDRLGDFGLAFPSLTTRQRKRSMNVSQNFDSSFFSQLQRESSHVSTSRTSFDANDRFKLLNVLSSCLSHGNIDRAKVILKNMRSSMTDDEYSLFFNEYITRLIEVNINFTIIEDTFKEALDHKNFIPTSKTIALLLWAASTLAPDLKKHEFIRSQIQITSLARDIPLYSIIEELFYLSPDSIPYVLRSGEIAQADLTDLPEEPKQYVDNLYRTLPTLVSLCSNKSQMRPLDPKQEIIEQLDDVESVGYKYVKSMLGGLADGVSFAPQEIQDALHKLSSSDRAQVSKTIPFFGDEHDTDAVLDTYWKLLEMSSNLEPEARAPLENVFDLFNRRREIALETTSLNSAAERWKEEYSASIERGSLPVMKKLNTLLYSWNKAVTSRIEKELDKMRDELATSTSRTIMNNSESRHEVLGLLSAIPTDQVSVITLLELLRLVAMGSEELSTSKVLNAIGDAIHLEYHVARYTKRNPNRDTRSLSNRQLLSIVNKNKHNADPFDKIWTSDTKVRIGAFVMSIVMDVVKVPVTRYDSVTNESITKKIDAFSHSYVYRNGKKIGIINPHPEILKYLAEGDMKQSANPQLLPMLVKPLPWTSNVTGGYLTAPNELVRTVSIEQKVYIQTAIENGTMDKVLESVSILGETPWTINSPLFEVIAQIWNKGEEFLDIPAKLSDEPDLPKSPGEGASPQERRDWARTCRLMMSKYRSDHSQRCDLNYKLEIARSLIGERFFFPHNVDFRGRAYPIPPLLNHLGNDLTRSLLVFWQPKTLGAEGLRWLKIHLANLFGKDKMSLDDRVRFVDEHLAEIVDSATNPLNGKMWWKYADKPFQTLGACMELEKALRCPDPTLFKSRLPIHQDGTCNGLQHYAALGGDIEGANQVNLLPAEIPRDVYTKVADMVRASIREDLEHKTAGVSELAALMADNITRKVVKQTVMTSVYGVTFVGAREQINGQLKEIDSIPEEKRYLCAIYVTKKVFGAIRELFYGAHEIQDWLVAAARIITKSVTTEDCLEAVDTRRAPKSVSSVTWTTPFGLPIVQPYRKMTKEQVVTRLQTVYLSDPYQLNSADSRKQASALPPNFIHSLDATHMMMTAIECHKAGLSFASVHDSYWTHACDVGEMNDKIRACFVRLHTSDLVAKLHKEFMKRTEFHYIPINIVPSHPKYAQLKQLAKDTKERIGRMPHLRDWFALEAEREVLLKSSDEAEREEGRNMVTASTILSDLEFDEISGQIMKSPSRSGKPAARKHRKKSSENAGEGPEVALVSDEDIELLDEAAAAIEEEGAAPKVKGSITVPWQVKFPEIPKRGDLDLTQVLKSQYFFS
ncbi:hypothetical protein CANCADRAFT_31657 [Tortispora caseinolytica NRRL Y-17796]|uniref:DNA-directed RNA polymerase n=1 Tax=Tortispora caseinolytica NRRL Y-17796 TaxID=767744 RepID=A0A1E4TGB0_9ASCO|nr:hypothetical protein CANCADRAFT_31657 [Tortispora caseinolytica NRRL Y-17796]